MTGLVMYDLDDERLGFYRRLSILVWSLRRVYFM